MLACYAKKYGGQLSGPKSVLPRRSTRKRSSDTGMAAFLRLRQLQKDEALRRPEELSAAAAKRCIQTVEDAAAERASKKQKTLATTLANRCEHRLHDLSTVSKQKLEEQIAAEEKRLQQMQSIQRRDLHSSPLLENCTRDNSVLVCIPTRETADIDQKIRQVAKTMEQLGGPRVTSFSSSTMICKVLDAKVVFWFALTTEAEQQLLYYRDLKPELGSVAVRMLGGWLAGPSWLSACVARKALVTPILRLGPALRAPREIGFDPSCNLREGVLKLLSSIESHPQGHRFWVIRAFRKDLTRKTGWWIIEDEKSMQEADKKGKAVPWKSFLNAIAQWSS